MKDRTMKSKKSIRARSSEPASVAKNRGQVSLAVRFKLVSNRTKAIIVTGLVSGAAAVIAVILVVTSSPQPLIQLAATQGGSDNRSATMSEISDDKMMIMPFTTYSYVAGAGLSSETGSGQVYKLVRTGSPESVLAKIAQVFDIQGSVKKYPDFTDQNPGYFFGESDDPWGGDNVNPMVERNWVLELLQPWRHNSFF
jgi:hypothetical protein